MEARQAETGRYVSCIEEVAWRSGFISREEMAALGEPIQMTEYGRYLMSYREGIYG